jgi:hypothetical protein
MSESIAPLAELVHIAELLSAPLGSLLWITIPRMPGVTQWNGIARACVEGRQLFRSQRKTFSPSR